jgi:putative flippase GtrA
MLLRIFRFSFVGLLSTCIHGLLLYVFGGFLRLGGSASNLFAFIFAFIFSIHAQQAFTFRDRLGESRLNSKAIGILFLVNALAAFFLGASLHGWAIAILPLVPAAINYILLYLLTGLSGFRS